jgi:hypothetical protein
MSIEVEPFVFSGQPNPTFDLDLVESADLLARVATVLASGGQPAEEEIGPLDYAGFRVSGTGLPGELHAFRGKVMITSPAGRSAFPDVSGVESLLIEAARNHGLGDLFDDLNIA